MDGSHALFEVQERPTELPRKIGACGGLEPKKLNISMYVVCTHCILQLHIDSVIVTNKYQMQINVLAAVTRFIIVAEMLLLGPFPRPRPVADVQKPNTIKVIQFQFNSI